MCAGISFRIIGSCHLLIQLVFFCGEAGKLPLFTLVFFQTVIKVVAVWITTEVYSISRVFVIRWFSDYFLNITPSSVFSSVTFMPI